MRIPPIILVFTLLLFGLFFIFAIRIPVPAMISTKEINSVSYGKHESGGK
jgi:hypothetical protein